MAKEKEAFESKAYRIYVSDSLYALIGNGNNPRYMDVIDRTVVDEKEIEEKKKATINRIKNLIMKRGV